MSRPLRDELAEAEARVETLKRDIARDTSCLKNGHVWKIIGGKIAGCARDCCCSIPVNECSVCGDCDYGDNAVARAQIDACKEEDRLRADEDWFFDMDGHP